jgi:membrane-bound ClpP family serine protease
MEWLTVILFILIGIVLIVLEIIIIPGTTIVGIFGLILSVVGIVLGFHYFGPDTGWMLLAITGVLSGGMFYWALRSDTWKKFSLKNTLQGKVNEGMLDNLVVGQKGITTSALRPMGKADVNGQLVEVSSRGNFIPAGTPIKIVSISANHISVETIN